MKVSEFLKKAAKIGCQFVSHGKEHDVWYSPKTGKYFRVGRHGSQEIKGGTLNSMMKDAGHLRPAHLFALNKYSFYCNYESNSGN